MINKSAIRECMELCRKCAAECTVAAMLCQQAGLYECAAVCTKCAAACKRVLAEGFSNMDVFAACEQACNTCTSE